MNTTTILLTVSILILSQVKFVFVQTKLLQAIFLMHL